MKQGINKALALFLAVVLAFSPIAAAFGDSMTVYATEATTESETGRSRSAADLHEALETRAETETKVVQNDNKISDDTGKDDGDTTGSGNSSSNGNSNNAGNSDNGGSKRETPAQPTTQEYKYTVNLPGKVGGVDFGTVTLTVNNTECTVSGNKVTLPTTLKAGDITAVKSSNYILSDVSVEGTTITIATATPNVSITMTGAASITVGNTEKYAVTLSDEVWKDAVTWELSDKNVATLDKTTGNEVNVKAKGFAGGDSTATTLTAKVGTVSKSIDITIKKKEVSNLTLAVTPSENGKQGWKTPVNVTVTTDPELAGQTVKITKVKDGSKETKDVTIGQDGTGRIAGWELDKAAAEYSFTASFAGNETYASKTTAEATEYKSTLEKQDPFQLKGDNIDPDKTTEVKDKDGNITQYQYELKESVYPTYGAELEIGTIFGGTEDTWNPSDYSFTNNGNNNLKVDAGKLYFTAKQAGEFNITVTRKKDGEYNSVSMSFKITVKKKELHIDNSSIKVPENRVYDGTNVINDIKAKFIADDLVENDKANYENKELTLTGQTQDANANAGTNKEVSIVDDEKLRDQLPENYELVGIGKLTANVSIAKRKVITKVIQKPENSNGKMEMVSDGKPIEITRPFTEISKTDDLVVAYLPTDETNHTGFVGNKVPDDLSLPGVKTSGEATDQSPEKTYTAYYVPDFPSAEKMGNYEFDTDSYVGANLKITAASADNTTVSVLNSDSKNVYQKEAGSTIYYSSANPVITWNIADTTTYSKVLTVTASAANPDVEPKDGWTECIDKVYTPDTSQENINLWVKLKTNAGGETKPFKLQLIRDDVMPEATVTLGKNDSTMYNFVDSVTFGHFTNNVYNAEINVRDDGSGIKSWSYKVIKITKDSEGNYNDKYTNGSESWNFNEFTKGKDTSEKIRLGASNEPNEVDNGNFVVFVLVTDNVNNSKLYGSNGVVIDNVRLNSLTLEYKGNGITKEDGVTYFKDKAELSVAAEENDEGSAVKSIDATITEEDNKPETENLYTIPEPESHSGYTLAELDTYKRVSSDKGNVDWISRTIDPNECKKYTVSVNAEDMAGNIVASPVTKTFVLDSLAPVFINNSIAYSEKNEKSAIPQDNNVYYSNKDVTISTTVKERFTDKENIKITLKKGNTDIAKSLADWMNDESVRISVDAPTSDSNDSEWKIEFTVPIAENEEQEYSYKVEVTDYSGNTSKSDEIKFCLDNVAPVAAITYTPYASDQDFDALANTEDRIYLNAAYQSFGVDIQVKEKYFANSSKEVNCEYAISAEDIKEADESGNNAEISKLKALGTKLKKLKDQDGEDIWISKGNDTYDYAFGCTEEANYTFEPFKVTDLAGNECIYEEGTFSSKAQITLDKTKPDGEITVNAVNKSDEDKVLNWTQTWKELVDTLTFGLFGRTNGSESNGVTVSFKSSDITAGVQYTGYITSSGLKTQKELEGLANEDWMPYEEVFSLGSDQQYVIYGKVVDNAGNTKYIGTDRVIMDDQDPAPEISITPIDNGNEGWKKNQIYRASDEPGFNITVTEPEATNDKSYSGLQKVSYTISNGCTTDNKTEGTLFEVSNDENTQHQKEYSGTIHLDPDKSYSNEVKITVTAIDRAGNKSEAEQSIAVDNVAPVVSFKFSNDKVANEKYYNTTQSLTITVLERNFDEEWLPTVTKDEQTATAGKDYEITKWSHDGEKHTATITFEKDGDYKVSYWCKDLAGNVSVTETGEEINQETPLTLPEFTIDKTAPKISVSYDKSEGGSLNDYYYYSTKRTATITVTEHNFDPQDITVTTTGSLDGTPLENWKTENRASELNWNTAEDNADKHTATIEFSEDADYSLYIAAKDRAGNQSKPGEISNQFTVDKIVPVVSKESTINYKGNQRDKVYYSNTGVTITTTITERHTDDEHIKINLLKDVNDMSKTLADWKKAYAENETNIEVTRSTPDKNHKSTITVKIPAIKDKEVHYTYSVTVDDYAANTATGGNLNFWLDQKKPEINSEIAYVGSTKAVNEDEGVCYSNKDVELTTTIREQLIDDEKIDLSLIVDGKETKATLKDWKNTEGVTLDKSAPIKDDNTTNATRTIKLRIAAKDNEEHHYIWSVSATDYAGNNDFPSTKTEFWLDKKAPDADITYTLTEKKNNNPGTTFSNPKQRVYVGEDYSNFVVNINVDEAHFVKHTGKGKVVACTYDPIETTNAKDPISVQVITPNSKNKGTDVKEIKDVLKKASSWAGPLSQHSYTFTCTADANYTFPEFTVTDLAGNTTTVSGAKITLDKVRPTGTLKVTNLISGGTKGEISWNKLVSKLSFGLFGKNSVKVSMSSEDATAGLKSTQYIVTDTLKKRSELEAETKWKDYKKGNVLKLNKNRNYIVYEKVIDKAGNTDYFGTDRVVVDGNSPKPEVTITPSAPGRGKGVYSASDNPGFDILVTDPIENDSYAGLKSVTYTISGGANGYKESNTVTFTAKDHRQSYTGHVNIDPSRFYSNNVQVTVEAVDYSTNGASKQTEEIKIDNQEPKVSFSFDKSDAVGGKYYNKDKTLTITVDERNFDDSYKPEVTSSTNQGWSFSGWSGNGEKHTGTITFTGDADYTVSYFCYDKAGNKSNTEKLDEITIDKTKPTVAVSYDNNNAKNGSYYQEGRTATITITEHNFNASGVTVTTTANLDGGSVAVPQASGWSSSGDTHTATISYPTDGDYTFTISITDMASNVSDPYATDSFTVDLTKPTIEISNIEDHSANKGTVAPVVTLNDTNFDRSNVNIQLTGVHKGVVNTANMYTTADTGKGQVITFANFGKNMDDIYTLKAETTDKAGNAYSTEIVFSVNRDGSTYQYNDYTEELLKKGYTNNPKDIVVSEINVDSLTLSELTLSKNGTVLTLKEGQDYDVQKSGGDVSWKEYVYTIHAANFEDEGDYTISIYSEDKAKNKTTNTSKAKQVEFIVDKTSPVISVANLQEGGHYKTDEQEFTANVDDNMALDKVEYYVDGELKESFDEKAVIEQNGALKLKVGSAAKFQEVSVKAYDKADNEPTIVTMNVLVSASGWVQFYNNKPLFFGTIILILLIVVGGVIIVMRVNRNGSLKMTTNRKEQRK